MRKLREVLRLYFGNKLSARAVARSVGASSSVINNYVGRAKLAGLSWPLPPELEGDAELEAKLFPTPAERPWRVCVCVRSPSIELVLCPALGDGY
jgi:hypothetical protein